MRCYDPALSKISVSNLDVGMYPACKQQQPKEDETHMKVSKSIYLCIYLSIHLSIYLNIYIYTGIYPYYITVDHDSKIQLPKIQVPPAATYMRPEAGQYNIYIYIIFIYI